MVNKENKIRDLLTNYDFMEDIEVLLFDIGKILDNKDLIEMFKKPRTIEEIVKDLFHQTPIEDIDELEVIETTRDTERESKYGYYTYQIVKHIPSGKFYLFSTETKKLRYYYYLEHQFMGEVEEEEIVTMKWTLK
jgi:hypothetical protein